jgi:hypothetical protein
MPARLCKLYTARRALVASVDAAVAEDEAAFLAQFSTLEVSAESKARPVSLQRVGAAYGRLDAVLAQLGGSAWSLLGEGPVATPNDALKLYWLVCSVSCEMISTHPV